MDKKKLKRIWKKTWFILWEDESWYSWIISAIVAFVLIKFLVYPGLGLTLGTSHPIVAVVSGSMGHEGGFDGFWGKIAICDTGLCTQERYYADIGITEEEFKEFPFHNGFNKGDIMFLYGTKNIDVGDTIVFISEENKPIIHRVIKKDVIDGNNYYQTKGDNNEKSIYEKGKLVEYDIPDDVVIGKAVFRIPFVGYIKIWFVYLITALGII